MPRALITGAGGLLAPYLAEAFSDCQISLTLRGSGCHPADLARLCDVRQLVSETRPDIVLHCAALTDVDACEADFASAFAANALAVGNIASSIARDARLVLVSTDQVYDGCQAPHREDMASPVNIYGSTKLAGEWAALAHHRNSIVLRTNFFGPSRTTGRASLSDFFERAFKSGARVKLFGDAIFSPLHARSLARIVRKLAFSELGTGVFNVGARDGLSKAEFALRMAAHKGLDPSAGVICESSSLPGRAPRPLDLRMDVSAIEALLGERMPTLDNEIRSL